jgi:imidazolonepropionase-like amidohydrolase
MAWSDIGTLEPGKLADVIAVAGNPLADIGAMDRVKLVVREGEVVKRDL